jgi:hypothetical protein
MGATVAVGHLLERTGHRRQSRTHPLDNHGRTVTLFPNSTCKWADHCTACAGPQEGRHRVEELLRAVSPMRNCGVHYCHTGAHSLPPRGHTTDYGMYPVARASLKHRGTKDFLPVCYGNGGSGAETPKAKYHCTPSQDRGGASAVAMSLSSPSAVEADAGATTHPTPWS